LSDSQIKKIIVKKLSSNHPSIKHKKRSLSVHVGTRWYRAPEISLLEKQYDQASDLWSVGCCIYEIMVLVQNLHNPV
jgi:serine/threonine protein kinase